MSLKLPDSGAETLPDGRRLPASAQRNAEPILQVLREHEVRGSLLELASGSGLHAGLMAAALPAVTWQPTDLEPANIVSITAWTNGLPNVLPPRVLDACVPDWHRNFARQDAVLLVNLLHLIPETAAATLLAEVAACLAPNGIAFLYGPFLRDGIATSAGDAAFDASLRAQNPAIGYKDLDWITTRLAQSGLTAEIRSMPANNLMLIARSNSNP
jgi:SAM-dependent methyltransferase